MVKTLIVFCHSNPEKSVQNKKLLDLIKENANVTVIDVCKQYAGTHFEMTKEQIEHDANLVIGHDRIIFQFPLYWLNMPPCGRHWQDQVMMLLTEGQFQGKELGVVTTTNAPKSVYEEVYKSPELIFYNYQVMATYLKAKYLRPIFFYPDKEEVAKSAYLDLITK